MMATMTEETSVLRFNGSIWCNLDIALRSVDQLFRQEIRPAELTVIEWYILRALYKRDGQHASELANAVGRAATSFTPNLDKLQNKGLIERRPDPSDRRAVRIYLTNFAQSKRSEVLESAQKIDTKLAKMIGQNEFLAFQSVLGLLQTISDE